MSLRSAQAYLWDVHYAASSVIKLTDGKTLRDYTSDEPLRWAIERQMITIGEALRNAIDLDPALSQHFPDARTIIAFRNRVVHGYFNLDNETVWGIIVNDLPVVIETLERLLPDDPPNPFATP